MKLYNTLTKKIEEFIPNEPNHVKLYTCGPTVYHYAHIGNLRNYIGHDILDKTLRYLGYTVTRAMNITDVGHLTSDADSGEDKMEVAKRREQKTALEIADFYTKAFFRDFELLNCKRPEIISPATENIDMYIKMIDKLLKDGYAYPSGGNIYFDISKLADYYALSNHQEEKMAVGVREGVDVDEKKRNQADFVLWFTTSKFENHELLWDSPWGEGYPGWHIECSGISIRYLGELLDIHGGGVDNIFPHHTNEIAQSEAYLGHKWCNYWFHNEHLIDETGKMSKSKGDFLTLSLLQEKGYHPLAYRLFCLGSHYRKQLVFSYENLKQAQITYEKLRRRVKLIQENSLDNLQTDFFQIYQRAFQDALEQDLNTANALTVLYDVIKDEKLNYTTKLSLIENFETVLSLGLLEPDVVEVDAEYNTYIQGRIDDRNLAKKNKDYALADQIRQELLEQGVILKDTKDGTVYEIEKR